jgi:hypothetical protein
VHKIAQVVKDHNNEKLGDYMQLVLPFGISTHLVLGWRNFASTNKTFDSHSPEAVCNSPVLAVMTG